GSSDVCSSDLFRAMALPTLKPASGLNGETKTRSPASRYLRYLADVAARRRLSASTPTDVPSLSRAPSIAFSSTPRAPPEITDNPWLAADRARLAENSRSASSASRDPTTATPPLLRIALLPQPKRTGGEAWRSLLFSLSG